jgi:hypothetical protein
VHGHAIEVARFRGRILLNDPSSIDIHQGQACLVGGEYIVAL